MVKTVKLNYLKDLYLYMAIPFIGYGAGKVLDYWEDERLSRFRDKSKLYAREIPPSKPSW